MASSPSPPPVEKVGLDLEAAKTRQRMRQESQDVETRSFSPENASSVSTADASTIEKVAVPIHERTKIVIVGLGMVAIAFIEKILKNDEQNKKYCITVLGEEAHVAYNRVGLTSFFEHRNIEDLYLNPEEWYRSHPETLHHQISTKVILISPENKTVTTEAGVQVPYDILVLAAGSDAVVPASTPGHDSEGVFVYRNIDDLEKMIEYSALPRAAESTGLVVGGGLLGLEAAKAVMDLNSYKSVKLVDKNPWVLSRQLDQDAGKLVIEKVEELGLEVISQKRIKEILKNEENQVSGVIFEDGQTLDNVATICYAIGIRPRDELAASAGIKTSRSGGYIIDKNCETNIPGIYAIGECASWDNQTFGLIAPGVEMADVLSFNLTSSTQFGYKKQPKEFRRPDLSTKLKLLGVNVASFGDFFADRDGPRELPEAANPKIKALSYKDPFESVYKKYLFTADGKYLIGGMIIGDVKDYLKLVSMTKVKKPLEVPPSQFILGAHKEGDEDANDLPADMQVCSCHNITKGDIAKVIRDGSCKSIGEIKAVTKAGSGCGGCMPVIQTIFNVEMKAMGAEVKNYLCPHFAYSRTDLFNIIAIKKLQTLEAVMAECGRDPNSLGCEVCKPCLGSIFASLFNRHVMDKPMHGLQDTNDKFLANIQRNGTFSVIPRVAGGEITPDKLIAIGQVAKEYGLYCKITGGQRIDMFGARKQDLVDIWTKLVDAGMESGHAYAKSLRTIKSCVGTSWCRFGIGDSVGMAIRLENRYKSIRSPHKIKSGVSGCVRECAEAQNKDFGLIATEKGFNIFVGGNGGSKPRHSEILIKDCPLEEVIPVLDRYIMFYIRTADKLQRTARWVENLPGGIKYLREVILEDRLGICADLEKQMEELVGTYFCEWTEVVKNPERKWAFQQFANTGESQETVELIKEREQKRPSDWPKDSVKEDFKGTKWTSLSWQPIIKAEHFNDDAPSGSSAAIKRGDTQLAIFKIRGKYYATQQMCPHKRAFVLSDGLIGDDDQGKLWVSCPYHKRNYELSGENAGGCRNDEEVNIATFPVEERADGWVYLKLPPVEELDARLGTERWKVRTEATTDQFKGVDGLLKGRKSKKIVEPGMDVNTEEEMRKPISVDDSVGKRLDW